MHLILMAGILVMILVSILTAYMEAMHYLRLQSSLPLGSSAMGKASQTSSTVASSASPASVNGINSTNGNNNYKYYNRSLDACGNKDRGGGAGTGGSGGASASAAAAAAASISASSISNQQQCPLPAAFTNPLPNAKNRNNSKQKRRKNSTATTTNNNSEKVPPTAKQLPSPSSSTSSDKKSSSSSLTATSSATTAPVAAVAIFPSNGHLSMPLHQRRKNSTSFTKYLKTDKDKQKRPSTTRDHQHLCTTTDLQASQQQTPDQPTNPQQNNHHQRKGNLKDALTKTSTSDEDNSPPYPIDNIKLYNGAEVDRGQQEQPTTVLPIQPPSSLTSTPSSSSFTASTSSSSSSTSSSPHLSAYSYGEYSLLGPGATFELPCLRVRSAQI